MTIEISLLIGAVSLAFAIYSGISNLKRNKSADDKAEASQIMQVMVKLDLMSNTLSEIKADIKNVKVEVQDLRERVVVVEQSTKSLHHRVDSLEEKADDFK